MKKLIIKNIDKNKSYAHLITTKSIPVYAGDQCACQYGYNCDESFDRSRPLYYTEVSINDTRNKINLD
jgi:hypothetical protein